MSNYYKKLFSGPSGMSPFCLYGAFPKLSENSCRLLESSITRQEIRQIVMNMGGFKAPGPDGLQAIFYQSQWNIVGEKLCKLILDIFADHRKVGSINSTLITLIPKVENVKFVRQFRPISLCNVSYKIVTKILAKRLLL